MKRTLIIFLLTAFSSLGAVAQNLHLDAVDQFVTLVEDNNRGIGTLTISKEGKELYHRNFGQLHVPSLSLNASPNYQIGSITKTYTAVLIFQLVAHGRLSLDDTLDRFFPDMPGAQQITIRQMLEHTSGLGDYVIKGSDSEWLFKKVTEQEILSEIMQQGLVAPPGTKESYSNSAYYLLAKIAEQLYQNTYGFLIQEYICKPYGLKNTASVLMNPQNISTSYQYLERGTWQEAEDFYFPNTKGAGDITATTQDLLLFINALFQYKIFPKETVDLMKPILEKNEYFGRGLMLIPMRTQILYGHGGDTRGTHSVVGYNEKDGVSLALVLNGERYTRNQFLLGVLSIMYEEPFELPVFTTLKLDARLLETYTGTYGSPDLPIKVVVTLAEGVLYAQGTGQPIFPLEAYEENKFKFEAAGAAFEFLPKKNTVLLYQGGMTIEMKREQ